MTIPNIIHFIFGLDRDFGGKPFSFVHYLTVRTAAAVNKPSEMVLHHAYEPSGPWWEAAKPYVTLDRVQPPTSILGRPVDHFAHRADILRLDILRAEGGIYLDMDVVCVRSLAPLRSHTMVMGLEPNAGLCNAVLLASPGAPFLELWRDGYGDFDGARWNFHSVMLPYRLSLQNPALIDVVDEYGFFFPTYNDPMHSLLWSGAVSLRRRAAGILGELGHARRRPARLAPWRRFPYLRHLVRSREWYYRQLRRSYCVHLWETLWWDRYLRDIEPGTMARSEGLFRRLIEEILPDQGPGRSF